jgi:heat shock protein HslJ
VDGALTVVPETAYADAEFASRRVSGFSGCNTYDALYQAGGRTLFVTRPRSTLIACDEASMAFEQAFLAALANSRFFTARQNTLTIFDSDRNTILAFDAAPRNPLLGKWLVEGYGTPPSTVNALLPDTELDVTFGIVTIGGHAGCNSFSGTYGTNGDIVRVSQLATTRLACEQPIMDQETAFLAALQTPATVEQNGGIVTLRNADGATQVTLVTR